MEISEGPNRWRVEGDILHLVQVGVVTEALIQTSIRLMDQVLTRHPYVFVSADGSQVTRFEPKARQAMGTYANLHRIGCTVTFGAPFAVRTLLTFIFHATRLLGRASFPSYYPKTEAEGLAFIQDLRQKLNPKPHHAGL